MGAVIIEHVKVGDLPEAWRARLPSSPEARVTVRIEEEASAAPSVEGEAGEDVLFGMWRDREEMANVEDYLRQLRAPRHAQRNEPNQG